jgi:hypothetical protein
MIAPFEIEAVIDGKVEAVVIVGEDGSVVTVWNGQRLQGFHGPFSNAAFHTKNILVRNKYPTMADEPQHIRIPPALIAQNLPPRYMHITFVKKAARV